MLEDLLDDGLLDCAVRLDFVSAEAASENLGSTPPRSASGSISLRAHATLTFLPMSDSSSRRSLVPSYLEMETSQITLASEATDRGTELPCET